jgi:GT2 family glycosyltransferase
MILSIIILSYNTKDLTLACLHSLIRSITHSLTYEIIVVDNASVDGSQAAIATAFPQIKMILSPVNKGFAAANNLAMAVATGKYYLLLNSDTVVSENSLETMIAYLDHHPKIGALTPKVVLSSGAVDMACHRGMPTPWNAFTYFSHLEKLFPKVPLFSGYHQSYKDMAVAHQIDATAATALMVRASMVQKIGRLDERFFLYGEDLDWCQRMTEANWQIWYFPTVSILHLKSASGKKKSGNSPVRQQSINYFYDTMKQFYEKHYSKKYPKWLRQLVYWGIDLKKKLHG